MTEKRFTIQSSMMSDGYVIIDKEKKYTFPVLDSTLNHMFCKSLNELHEENIMLKGEVAHYKLTLMSLEKEAKRLSQIRR